MSDDHRIPLTDVMPLLRQLSDDEPTGGYGKLYRAVLDGRLPTHRRGAQHDISRDDLPLAARIVGMSITDSVSEAV